MKDLLESFGSRRKNAIDLVSLVIPGIAWRLFQLWYSVMHYFYIVLPLSFARFCWRVTYVLFQHATKCSPAVRKFEIHTMAIYDLLLSFLRICIETKISLLIIDVLQCICDITLSWFTSSHVVYVPIRNQKLGSNVTNLVYYEEISPDDTKELNGQGQSPRAESIHMKNKMKQTMHHYVSPRMFRATVRVPKKGSGKKIIDSFHAHEHAHESTPLAHVKENLIEYNTRTKKATTATTYQEDECTLDQLTDQDVGPYSPASFPPTPFSRARVMNKNTELVIR